MIHIIKQRPERRGSLRVYDITQIEAGRRTHIVMVAKAFREVTANLLANARQSMRVAA